MKEKRENSVKEQRELGNGGKGIGESVNSGNGVWRTESRRTGKERGGTGNVVAGNGELERDMGNRNGATD